MGPTVTEEDGGNPAAARAALEVTALLTASPMLGLPKVRVREGGIHEFLTPPPPPPPSLSSPRLGGTELAQRDLSMESPPEPQAVLRRRRGGERVGVRCCVSHTYSPFPPAQLAQKAFTRFIVDKEASKAEEKVKGGDPAATWGACKSTHF